MNFRSTRGDGPVDLAGALVRGLAPDGGLYMPASLPLLETPPAAAPLPAFAPTVLAPFLPEGCAWVAEAVSFDTPLVDVAPGRWLLDLTRGPTAAFKDVGARFLARALAELAPAPAGRRRTVLVATSGDTGGAVAAAFHGVPGSRVVVLFPADGVSPRQRRQFTTLGDDIVALGVPGPFDLCQRLVKRALADEGLVRTHLLTSANSINVGRLLPQLTWYLKALAELDGDTPVTFIVPSGNLGNLTAGLLADAMTGRRARFVAALNDNDAFAAWLAGEAHERHDTVVTPSTAMDVGRPSNLERIEVLDREDPTLRDRLRAIPVGGRETLATMRRVHREQGRFVDPHTAVGLAALKRLEAEGSVPGPAVVLETAHPGKFPATVRAATGASAPVPEVLAGLDGRTERWRPLEPDLAALSRALDETGSGP